MAATRARNVKKSVCFSFSVWHYGDVFAFHCHYFIYRQQKIFRDILGGSSLTLSTCWAIGRFLLNVPSSDEPSAHTGRAGKRVLNIILNYQFMLRMVYAVRSLRRAGGSHSVKRPK